MTLQRKYVMIKDLDFFDSTGFKEILLNYVILYDKIISVIFLSHYIEEIVMENKFELIMDNNVAQRLIFFK